MIFKKLVFNNYKTFYGLQEIDFYIPEHVRNENKNIILIGGLNGAGKTTILKAILYILFGKRGMHENEYKRIFANTINNTFFEEGGRECSVSLILETDNGEEWQIKVKWYVDNYKNVTYEERDLEVRKPGSKIPKHARIENIESYNKFIDKIIPFHAAPFFIFDGEEVKDIILRQNSKEMKDAIHKITGMESYKLLLTDLNILKQNIQKKLSKAISYKLLNKDKQDIIEKENSLVSLINKRTQLLEELNNFRNLIEKAKEKRNSILVQNSKSREVLIKKQTRISTELELAKKELSNYLDENLIILMLREKIQKLKIRLNEENKLNQQKIVLQSSLSPYRKFIEQLINSKIDPPLTEKQLEQLKIIGEKIWIKENQLLNVNTSENKMIHDISRQDYLYLSNIPLKDKYLLTSIINKIDKLQLDYNLLEKELLNAPETVNVDKENEKIDFLTRKFGEVDLKRKSVDNKIQTLNEEIRNIKNKISRTADLDSNTDELQKLLDNLEKLIEVMNHFVEQATVLKAKFIREEFALKLNQLFRKQEEFGKIEFDLKSYTIKLYNDKFHEISIHERSAGEMQMISSALIWALTKASDLALPMVIDTPLGRLDSFHRNHLINNYYKELSKQVIILSTDTEITTEYIEIMTTHSYKQFMLDYDENKKYTIIRDGYFQFVKG